MAIAITCLALAGSGQATVPTPSAERSSLSSGKLTSLAEDEYTTTVERGVSNVGKAKLQFSLPTLYFRGDFIACIRRFTEPALSKSCPPEFTAQIPEQYKVPGSVRQLQGGHLEYYLARREGSRLVYGSAAGIRVKTLALGSVPVEATIHLTQSVVDGFVDPLRANATLLTQLTDIDAGSPSWPGFPPVPQNFVFGDGYVLRSDFRALFDVRLSDVTVDGRALAVGTHCATRTPSRFSAVTARGRYPGFGADVVRGKPSGFNVTVDPVGYFDGTINLPAFSGCGTGGDDLDPLLTSFISGPNNRVSGFVPRSPITNLWCEQPIADCSQTQRAGEKRARALAIALRSNASPATILKLRARMQPSDYELPKLRAPKK